MGGGAFGTGMQRAAMHAEEDEERGALVPPEVTLDQFMVSHGLEVYQSNFALSCGTISCLGAGTDESEPRRAPPVADALRRTRFPASYQAHVYYVSQAKFQSEDDASFDDLAVKMREAHRRKYWWVYEHPMIEGGKEALYLLQNGEMMSEEDRKKRDEV
jgi:hypothetical protein